MIKKKNKKKTYYLKQLIELTGARPHKSECTSSKGEEAVN